MQEANKYIEDGQCGTYQECDYVQQLIVIVASSQTPECRQCRQNILLKRLFELRIMAIIRFAIKISKFYVLEHKLLMNLH